MTSLPAYWTFLHEGTPADSCYVLLEGQARVLAGRLECALAGPGSVLGEVGLLNRSLRTATVVTDTPVLALRIEYDVLSALCHAHPQLGQSVQAVFGAHRAADSRRIRQSALAVQGLEA